MYTSDVYMGMCSGGQTPLYMRLPKGRGTKQKFRSQVIKPQIITIQQLNNLKNEKIIGPKQLKQYNLIKSVKHPVKIIGSQKLTNKVTIRAHAYSTGAEKSIKDAGGKAEVIK